jgi:hypothetical protein
VIQSDLNFDAARATETGGIIGYANIEREAGNAPMPPRTSLWIRLPGGTTALAAFSYRIEVNQIGPETIKPEVILGRHAFIAVTSVSQSQFPVSYRNRL